MYMTRSSSTYSYMPARRGIGKQFYSQTRNSDGQTDIANCWPSKTGPTVVISARCGIDMMRRNLDQ